MMKNLFVFTSIFIAFNCFSSVPKDSSTTTISDIFKKISAFFTPGSVNPSDSHSYRQSQNLWQPRLFSSAKDDDRDRSLFDEKIKRRDRSLFDEKIKRMVEHPEDCHIDWGPLKGNLDTPEKDQKSSEDE